MSTRQDQSDISRHCFRTDHNQARLINWAREQADAKHGENSIEQLDANDFQWLSILVEEVGEVAHALTYDSKATLGDVADELLDVLAVASAWLDAFRVIGVTPNTGAWLA